VTHDADPAPSPAPTLAETVAKLLADAKDPLKLADLTKSLKKAGFEPKAKQQKAVYEAELTQILESDPYLHYPSGLDGEERYWAKDEKAVLKAAAEKLLVRPKTSSELCLALEKANKKTDPAFINVLVQTLIASGELHKHPTNAETDPPRYATTEHVPVPTLAEVIAKGIKQRLVEATKPTAKKDLVKGLMPKGTPKEEFEAEVEKVFAELIAEKVLHEHPGKKTDQPNYSTTEHVRPPTLAEVITTGVKQRLAEEPKRAIAKKDLAKGLMPKGTKKSAFDAEVEKVIAELIASKDLYEYPGKAKAKSYTSDPPVAPAWYEAAAHKKSFDALLKAAKKIHDVGSHSLDAILEALREKLGGSEKAPEQTPEEETEKPVPPPSPPTKDLRIVIHEAYEHLCLFDEFQDRMVKIPRLYHETAKRFPGLNVEAFHQELEALDKDWKVELHKLNEVHLAKEKHLAIERGDRLYYFIIWK